jgi:hypothetical protein
LTAFDSFLGKRSRPSSQVSHRVRWSAGKTPFTDSLLGPGIQPEALVPVVIADSSASTERLRVIGQAQRSESFPAPQSEPVLLCERLLPAIMASNRHYQHTGLYSPAPKATAQRCGHTQRRRSGQGRQARLCQNMRAVRRGRRGSGGGGGCSNSSGGCSSGGSSRMSAAAAAAAAVAVQTGTGSGGGDCGPAATAGQPAASVTSRRHWHGRWS